MELHISMDDGAKSSRTVSSRSQRTAMRVDG